MRCDNIWQYILYGLCYAGDGGVRLSLLFLLKFCLGFSDALEKVFEAFRFAIYQTNVT